MKATDLNYDETYNIEVKHRDFDEPYNIKVKLLDWYDEIIDIEYVIFPVRKTYLATIKSNTDLEKYFIKQIKFR